MKTRHSFPRGIRVYEDVRIPMPDGVVLSARLWLPDDAETHPVPALLEHLPYRKRDGTIARDTLTHPYFAGHGYACLRVDMRGNGDSQGLMADEYEQQEWEDAIAVMAWVAEQSWSTGDWGMMGISWGGFNALQLAALRPKGLKAVISLCSTSDRYADDIHWKGGCMLGENLGWAAQMLAYSSRAPDPLIMGEGWRETWLERLQAQPFLLETWLGHQTRDAYWKHGSICEDWAAIDIPVLSIGGWHDGYRNTPAALVRNLSDAKAIVGPWNHKYPHFAGPGPQIGFLQEGLRWWDRWLKGKETGVERDPRERLYVMDSIAPQRWVDHRPGRWVALDADLPDRAFHLSQDGLRDAPDEIDQEVRSPQTCGEAAGEYFPFAFGPELPADQSADDAMSACFDAAPQAQDADIIGAPRLRLRLIPQGSHGQLAVRLSDMRPDGSVALITHGFLNLRHHKSHETPEVLTPGVPIDVTVTLDQCAYRLPKGHRLRLAVSTAYWPFIWPDPENAGVVLQAGQLDVPMRDSEDGGGVTFQEAEAAPAWAAKTHRAASMVRETETLADGTQVITLSIDNGAYEDPDHQLITGSASQEIWKIHPDDPLSATATITWTTTMARGDWSTRTECSATLRASRENWHSEASIKAFEGDALVFEKAFETRTPRDHL